jgi:photosystem II stability/assembly factor-like uncharacterized protein
LGSIYSTNDAGQTWTAKAVNQPFTGISCPTTSMCVAVTPQPAVTRTVDGGASWSTSAASNGLSGVSCPSTSVCFATTTNVPGGIVKSTNGGINWAASFDLSVYSAAWAGRLNAISCASASVCHASGANGVLAATSDGGANWRTEDSPSSVQLMAISCPAASTCFASGENSTILSTADYGATWNYQAGGAPGTFSGVSCPTATTCFAVGTGGYIAATTNGGAAWTRPFPAGSTSKIQSMSCATASDCYAVAWDTILTTHTGGNAWAARKLGVTDQLGAISCPAPMTCFAVGWPGAIYNTGDGGATWTYQSNPRSGVDMTWLGVTCWSSTSCMVVGSGGDVLSTSDGTTWALESSTTNQDLFGVSCPNIAACAAVGRNGTVLTRTGLSWHMRASGTTNTLTGVSCPTPTTCFAVGNAGTIIVTSNQGANWSPQSSGVVKSLRNITCVRTDYCLAAGSYGTAIVTVNGLQWSELFPPTLNDLAAVALPDMNHAWLGGSGGTILANWSFNPTTTTRCTSATTAPVTRVMSSTRQYSLANSDGVNWQEIDGTNLRLTCVPNANQSAMLTANSDLWTANAGFNQDLGIFVSDNGGADSLLAWKESGGSAGTYSPNAAYVQHLFTFVSGHTYAFTLKWKTNHPAPGATIYAGAGSGPYSPTSLLVETFPSSSFVASSTMQYSLSNSDGATWQTIDATSLSLTVQAIYDLTAVLGANADLWTANAGYNQDLAIFVSEANVPDTLVAWKESGGLAGTYSPNAAFLKATYPLYQGHIYTFTLKWKTNGPAFGASIYAAAGSAGAFSPTSLLVSFFRAGANPYRGVSTKQYSLTNSDGATWQAVDTGLNVTVTPGANTNTIIGANADLWTANAGYNQDIGVFVNDNGGADVLLAWKESGGFAGTYSPNAAFVQTTYPMARGHTYVFKLKWKTNANATGVTIYAAAGGGSSAYSPTSLTVELTG